MDLLAHGSMTERLKLKVVAFKFNGAETAIDKFDGRFSDLSER